MVNINKSKKSENILKIDNIEKVIEIKNENYYKIINENKNNLKMIDGCEEFMNMILEKNKKFIIVSNTFKKQIDFFSELFPILKKSSKNYYKEILKYKKPNPECYLKVINDFPNEQIVGFEDSITGIHSITQVPDIFVYYINDDNYYHNEYILHNYKVEHIKNYNNFISL